MRFATIRTGDGTIAARVAADTATELIGYTDVGHFLRESGPSEAATGRQFSLNTADVAPVITRPGKIICVGLNYRNHILEMGRELPNHPTLFVKFAESLIGPRDAIALPPESPKVDWEGELAIIIGTAVRRADAMQARAAIAGYTVMNDVTMRDWQYRTTQWFQGKAWEGSTPIGPVLVTPDELPDDATLTTSVNDEVVQSSQVCDLVFGPAELVSYISTIVTLNPGDIIASGTPGGVGHARTPERYLHDGDTVTTTIDGIGSLTNTCVDEERT